MQSPTLDPSFLQPTKTAKQRRHLINLEIDHIRSLLPLKDRSRQRLSQIEAITMACMFIRKNHYLGSTFALEDTEMHPHLQAAPGFFLVCSTDGKLIYISSNITDFLGHSVIDVIKQGDNLYNIVDRKDHEVVRAGLNQVHSTEVNFQCGIILSRYTRRQASFFTEKTVQVSGYLMFPNDDTSGQNSLLVAMCTPILSHSVKLNAICRSTMTFTSMHHLDMTFREVCPLGEFHLKASKQSLIGRSWYDFIHPDTLTKAASQHMDVTDLSSGARRCFFHGKFVNAYGEEMPVACALHWHKEQNCIISTTQILRSVTEASQHSTPEMECTTAAASPQHFYQDKYPVYWPVRGPTVPTHPILEPALPINYNKMMPGLLMPVPGLGPRATGLNDIDMERYQPLLDDMGNARMIGLESDLESYGLPSTATAYTLDMEPPLKVFKKQRSFENDSFTSASPECMASHGDFHALFCPPVPYWSSLSTPTNGFVY